MSGIKFHLVDSLQKVFPETEPKKYALEKPSLFQEEQFSFQLAYFYNESSDKTVQVTVKTDDSIRTEISKVVKVPSELPAYEDPNQRDDNYIKYEPGLYPDFLEPVQEGKVKLDNDGWNAIWFNIYPNTAASGEKEITIQVTDEANNVLYEDSIQVNVIPHTLPEQKLIHTEWFHADCLADYYNVESFSEEHWRIVENFIKVAAENGINMILTPVFTQPLDTKVGGERTTVQLVDITYENGEYSFDFTKLKRWLELCKRYGIKYLEIAHLFTQWGAHATPKIIVKENGELIKKFGWHVSATSDEYKEFLAAFLPALTNFLKENWEQENVYFHISDEPNESMMETYTKAKEVAIPYLEGFKVIDALSDYTFYEKGIVEKPIVANDAIDTFIEKGVKNLWTYYCCAQNVDVSNRFMAMPSARNRIIATQLFKYDIEGFLHWGFNFYNSQYSIEKINPYEVTAAKGAFPSGDPFLVYPGENGEALPSIRLRVFYQALQDLRAFQWLAELKGKDYVMQIIEENSEITFKKYPKESDYIFETREKVNQAIAQALAE